MVFVLPVADLTCAGKTATEQRVTVPATPPVRLNGTCQPIGEGEERLQQGRVCDLSAGGFRLVVDRRFEPGTVLIVEVQGETTRTTSILMVRVVRARREGATHWALGCQVARTLAREEVRDLL